MSSLASNNVAFKRVLWRCRRGMREVEILLLPFAKKNYLRLPPNQQHGFQELLDYPDTELFSLLNDSALNPSAEHHELVQSIRTFSQ